LAIVLHHRHDVVRVIALFDRRRNLRELLHDRFARASIPK